MANNLLIGMLGRGYDPAAREAELNALQMQRNELTQYPKDLQFKRESQDWERQDRLRKVQQQGFLDMGTALQFLDDWGQSITYENYPKAREELMRFGSANPQVSSMLGNILPPREYFDSQAPTGMTGKQLFERAKANQMMSTKKQLEIYKAETERRKIGYKTETKEEELDVFRQKEKIKAEEGKPKESAEKEKFNLWLESNRGKTYEDYMKFEQALKKSGFSIELDPETGRVLRIVQGTNIDITPKEKGELQKETGNLLEQISVLKKAGSDFKREYLTYVGAGKKFVLSKLSKLGADIGEEGKDFLAGRRAFIERIERFFNMYRKEITGAQAVMKELDMLRESVINKEMSPDEFEASYNRFMDDAKTALELKNELMQKGFSGKELGKKIDELFFERRNKKSDKKKTRKLSTGVVIIEED